MLGWREPPELCEVPVPEPGQGEVLIRIGGAGACHSDLHLMEWPEGTAPRPMSGCATAPWMGGR